MKILNLISTLGHGRGGHFYDLITITQELQKKISITTVNICKQESEVLNSSKINLINLKFNGLNIVLVVIKLIRIVKSNKITHINCYDLNGLPFANILSFFFKIKIIYTKCGGPNPKGYYPGLDNLLLMSKENFSFFDKNEKYKLTNKVLIPNRVNNLIVDYERIESLKNLIGNPKKIILRISRITDHYESTLMQTVNLYNSLNLKDKETTLLIIGVVQEDDLLLKLQNQVKNIEKAFFITDDFYTLNASELIPIADVVVGTGRGVMEASFFNKILLTPLKDCKYPVLISEANFEELFQTNFSPRNHDENYNEIKNLSNIESCLNDGIFYNKNIDFVKSIRKEYFDVSSVNIKYYNFFKKCSFPKFRIYDFIRLTLSVIIKFINII
tara:strand:- start:6705 stop:7862 length:1158 start_codon:yes stop_codon:yes gene_type:complete